MRLKDKVLLFRNGVSASPQCLYAIHEADKLHTQYTGKDLVVTSCVDGKHSPHSRHYTGDAFDMRIWYLDDKSSYRWALKEILGPDYDVVIESDHIHVEFDPER